MRECVDNCDNSVYHRAKLLAPIFPWLLFTALHPFTATTGVVGAAAVAVGDASPSNLRGRVLWNSNIKNNFHSHVIDNDNHHRRRHLTSTTVQNYCGVDWTDANSKCLIPCPDGDESHTVCGVGESCFADLTSCPSMIVLGGEESGLPPEQPPSLQVGSMYATSAPVPGVDDATTNINIDAGAAPSILDSTGTTTTTLPFQIGATIPSTCSSASITNSVNVGYYQSWAKYRSSNCNPITPSQIPVLDFGYTHLIYSFAGISNSGTMEPYNGVMDEIVLYEEFNSLKSSNVGLTTLIAVGGWNIDQTLFTRISSSESARSNFATSVVEFVTLYNFDGLDLDWEYPVTRQGSPEDYDNYPLLVQAIREVFAQATTQSGKEYLLTMAVPVNPEKLDSGFNMSELAKYVDWFHLMSYDIHGSWNEVAGSNTDLEYISSTVENNILGKSVSGEQLVFGMASYGRSMVLTEPSTCTTAGCPISGSTMAGCSGESGFSPYFELKETYVDTGKYQSLLLNAKSASMEMILDGGIFVSLDIDQTFLLKRDYYLLKCFRGQMWWAVDMIKDPPFGTTQVASTSDASLTAQAGVDISASSSVSTVVPNTAPGVIQDNSYCADTVDPGLVPIKDCVGFAFCQNSQMIGSVTMCSPGLIFDANMEICNWPSSTNVCGFEFCPNGMSGYVPFEDCTKFYYCKAGKIDGDIDVCPDGTLFDIVMGICNWADTVVCPTAAPTPMPVPTGAPSLPQPGVAGTDPDLTPSLPLSDTPRPTYGTVAANEQASASTSAGVSHDKDVSSSIQDQGAPLRFSPSDDAYVQESQPSINYNDRFVVVDQDERFDGLLRFYVQGIENRRVQYVKLRLFVSNEGMFGGNFYKCDADWHEDVVTWDTAPSIIGDNPLAVVNAVILGEWIEVDVTELVEGDGPVALRITSDSSDNVMYSSKENPDGNSPELIVGVEVTDLGETASSDIDATGTPTFKIGPTDDAFVFLTTADGNFGQHEDLMVGIGNGDKKSYLRFDLSKVDTSVVQSATLRLYATASSQSGGTFVTVTDSNWSENTITFNNAPTADGMSLGMLNNIEAGQWYELDITDAITESAPLTICILGNHEDKVMYSSKDGPHSPEITLILDELMPRSSHQTAEVHVMELSPTDDATIELQDADMNFGMSNELKADSNDGIRNFLLRFDASNVPRGEVKSAILRVYAMNEEPVFGGFFVENRDVQWNEQTVTWNSAPPSDGRVLGSLMEVEYGSWYNIDVTPAVIGGAAVSFRVSSPHFYSAIYGSKESDYKPLLIVQYSMPAPLPEDMLMLSPTDDTSVLMEKPTENFGRSEELRVDGFSGIYNSLLRFDLSSVEKGSVVQAILRLYAVDGSPSGGTFVRTHDTVWDQHKVTWNSAPAADGEVIETLGVVTPYQWYEIDLAAIVEDLGGEALSIRIAPSHGLRCAFASSRDRLGHSPQLLIKVDVFAGME